MRISSVSKTDVRHICSLAKYIVSDPLAPEANVEQAGRAVGQTGNAHKVVVRFGRLCKGVEIEGVQGLIKPYQA